MTTAETAPFQGLLGSWMLSLRAANKSPRTVENYAEGVTRLAQWLRSEGLPDDVSALTSEQVQRWLVALQSSPGRRGRLTSESTVRGRYVAVKLFLSWCQREGELAAHPMVHMEQPKVSEKVIPILTGDQLEALLRDCSGPEFIDVRDRALVMLFGDTTLRRAEVVAMRLSDLDLMERTVRVIRKGGAEKVVPFGASTAAALDRYVRARRRQRYGDRDWLWLSSTNKGRLTTSGLAQAFTKRGERLGFHLHPHMFRHTFADAWLSNGGSETDLMELGNWKSRQMIGRYSAARRTERAREAYRAMSPMDRRGS